MVRMPGRVAQRPFSYTFNQYLPPGEYKINRVDVRDLIGNVRTYTPAQLQSLGASTSLLLQDGHYYPPTEIIGGSLAVDENSPVGTLVGTVTGQDPGDPTLTYTLTNSAGGRFAIDNAGHITVANGSLLDYEQNSAHNVIVRATDPGGLFFEKAFTVAVGDVNPELLAGGPGADKVSAGDGNDQAFGNAGNDTINGGAGNDYINGGADHDYLFGDAGADTLLGDSGNDYLNAGIGDDLDGDDLVFGGEGADTVVGDPGNDYINGENGNDTVLGGSGNDTVLGGDGSDYINGGTDDDRVFGGNSADVL